jgi:hypothetical protein
MSNKISLNNQMKQKGREKKKGGEGKEEEGKFMNIYM